MKRILFVIASVCLAGPLFAQDIQPPAPVVDPSHLIADPCAAPAIPGATVTPCELDRLKLQVQSLLIERDLTNAKLAEFESKAAQQASQKAGNALVQQLFDQYHLSQKDYDFKQLDESRWGFVKKSEPKPDAVKPEPPAQVKP